MIAKRLLIVTIVPRKKVNYCTTVKLVIMLLLIAIHMKENRDGQILNIRLIKGE
jgi:hypothetical protein